MIHPAAGLLGWLILAIALQAMGWTALGMLALALLAAGPAMRERWLQLARRARWLLLTLWAIFAWGTPGEAYFDLAWGPTDAGVAEANLHFFRLLVTFGTLAWLFAQGDRSRMTAGLWGLVRPLGGLGVAVDRFVVRLSLVFEYVEEQPPRGSWRQVFNPLVSGEGGVSRVQVMEQPWSGRDFLAVAGVTLLAVAGACLP